MGALNKLNLDLIEEVSVDVNTFSKEYADWINNKGILYYNNDNTITQDGKFDSDEWLFYISNYQYYRYIDFKLLQQDINPLVQKDDITIIKCWIVELIRDGQSYDSVKRKYDCLVDTINKTKNFNPKVINGKKGNAIDTLMASYNRTDEIMPTIRSYIDFLDTIGLTQDGHMEVLNNINKYKTKRQDNIRKLPTSREIIGFEYYLKRFYNDSHNENLHNLYKPILLWWKITNVIPMRPSEFTFKLKKECIIDEDGIYYLKIDRVKVTSNSKKTGKIPIVSKLGITKEIYDLIDEYRQSVAFDDARDTLLSYRAGVKFRNDFVDSGDEYSNLISHHRITKRHDEYFNLENLNKLIKSFYNVVIKGIYKDNTLVDMMVPGDTRHLAFSALVTQGVSPIEIAMLGGHTTLNMQVSYTGHTSYYIDSEILDYVGNRTLQKNVSDKELIDIVFSKPYVCPKIKADCFPTEDGVGLCTMDVNKDIEICNKEEYCVYCEKWWCQPSNESFLKVKHYIENSLLHPLQETINQEEEFLAELLSKAKVVNVQGLLELDGDDEQMIRQARLKLKSDADKMIWLKKSLLESSLKKGYESIK